MKNIPGKEVSAALIAALDTPDAPLKTELIRALAARHAAAAGTLGDARRVQGLGQTDDHSHPASPGAP